MRRIVVVMFLLALTGTGYGAVSQDTDVYVRKDVFDAKMEALFSRIHAEIGEVRGDIKAILSRMDGLDKRMDSLDKRIDDLRNGIYLWMVAIGLVLSCIGLFVSWPKVKEAARKWANSTPSITLEDVKRLIEENNARMSGKVQA